MAIPTGQADLATYMGDHHRGFKGPMALKSDCVRRTRHTPALPPGPYATRKVAQAPGLSAEPSRRAVTSTMGIIRL